MTEDFISLSSYLLSQGINPALQQNIQKKFVIPAGPVPECFNRGAGIQVSIVGKESRPTVLGRQIRHPGFDPGTA